MSQMILWVEEHVESEAHVLGTVAAACRAFFTPYQLESRFRGVG